MFVSFKFLVEWKPQTDRLQSICWEWKKIFFETQTIDDSLWFTLILILYLSLSLLSQSNGAWIPRKSASCHRAYSKFSRLGTFLCWRYSDVHRCARLLHVNGLIQIVFWCIIAVSWCRLQCLQFRFGKLEKALQSWVLVVCQFDFFSIVSFFYIDLRPYGWSPQLCEYNVVAMQKKKKNPAKLMGERN